MKREINTFDRAGEILKAMNDGGILLTTKADGRVNTMTIGWGTIGVEFGVPIFIAFVRDGRHTRSMLDANPEFTINVPIGDARRKITALCGTKSGRDIDKIAAAGLTPEEPKVISVPGLRELPLTLECRVIYREAQKPECMSHIDKAKLYPQDVSGSNPMANRDYHVAYYGEIVSAYIIE